MKSIFSRLKNYYPLIFLLLVEIVLFFTNYSPGTYLAGWDNLFPELNFRENFERSLFSIWQQYRGLGLLDGMSHAANLVHYLFLYILSFFLPLSLLRYVFIFLMHLLGGVGMYYLISNIKYQISNRTNIKVIPLFGALFYQYNLATVQMFFAPFELFTVHFAFLPWLVWSLIGYLETGRKRLLIYLSIFSLLSTPQALVPTLFLVTAICLSVFLLFHLINQGREALLKVTLVTVLLFSINGFWGIPYIYSAFKNARTIANSKINLMATEDIYLRNKAYGDFGSVVLLKGFGLDFIDTQTPGKSGYMMNAWRKHTKKPLFVIIGGSFFALVLLGAARIFIKRKQQFYPLVILHLFTFLMLGNDIPVLRAIYGFFSSCVPYFFQIFRFTFTKFSILYAFTYSILFAVGLSVVLDKIGQIRHAVTFLTISLLVLLGYYSFPSWQGNFLYKNLRLKISHDYLELLEHFKIQDKNGRIATLPQPSFWGWTYTQWGYRGSGFIWYGLPQPTLDGAFYPWSNYNENYYWEITYAIYSLNKQLFEKVLEKYQINWIVLDHSVISPFSPKALYTEKLEEIINRSRKISFSVAFGKIKVYRVDLETEPKDFVYLASDLPVVGPKYQWNNYDRAYEEYGNYITDNRQQITDNKNSLFGARRLFGSRISQDSNSQSKDSYGQTSNSNNKCGVTHDLVAFLDRNKLKNQQDIENIQPNITRLQSILSTPEIIGGKTITPKNTWPALSKILANLSISSLLSTGSFGNGGLIKTIYAKNNQSTTNNQLLDSTQGKQLVINNYIYYPFRSLFTGRKQEELEFELEDARDYFSFRAKIPKELAGGKSIIPALNREEVLEVDESDLSKIVEKYPQVLLDGETIPLSLQVSSPSGEPLQVTTEVSLGYINSGNLELKAPKISGYYSAIFQPANQNLEPKSCDPFSKGLYTHEKIEEKGKSLLRLESINSSNCLDFDLPNLSQRLGYLVSVESRNIEGKQMLFSVINKISQRADLETYLPKNTSETRHRQVEWRSNDLDSSEVKGIVKSYFIIPPMEQYGLGYSLHFDNVSIGRVKTVNDLGKITVNPIPYRFLTSLRIVKEQPIQGRSFDRSLQQSIEEVVHPNPSFYQINLRLTNSSTVGGVHSATPEVSSGYLVLSQSFDEGWRAYQVSCQSSAVGCQFKKLFPFLFFNELKDHVLVNNWENGWKINIKSQISKIKNNEAIKELNNTTIIILYLPQYLQYLGFLLWIVIPVIILSTTRSNYHKIKLPQDQKLKS